MKKAPAQVEIQIRIRPIRVATRRQRELMVIIANSENGPEDAEWIEENELDLSGQIPGYPMEANNTSVPLPICSMGGRVNYYVGGVSPNTSIY